MSPNGYATARRQAALEVGGMYQVDCEAPCPSCGELVPCTVYVDDFETGECINGCHTRSHFDRDQLASDALTNAQSERRERAESV